MAIGTPRTLPTTWECETTFLIFFCGASKRGAQEIDASVALHACASYESHELALGR